MLTCSVACIIAGQLSLQVFVGGHIYDFSAYNYSLVYFSSSREFTARLHSLTICMNCEV